MAEQEEISDDIFAGIHELDMDLYQQGFENGEQDGLQRNKEKSVAEGVSYGVSIGNHVGYYATIIETMKKGMPGKFQGNKRLTQLCEKLEKKLNSVKIEDCYEDFFEKDQEHIKKLFLQIMSIVKVRTISDDPKKDIDF